MWVGVGVSVLLIARLIPLRYCSIIGVGEGQSIYSYRKSLKLGWVCSVLHTFFL